MLDLSSVNEVNVETGDFEHVRFTELTQCLLAETEDKDKQWREAEFGELVAALQYAYIVSEHHLQTTISNCLEVALQQIESSESEDPDKLLQNCLKLFTVPGASNQVLALASTAVNKVIRRLDMAQESTESLLKLVAVLHRGLSVREQVQLEEGE